jgi:nitroreductase
LSEAATDLAFGTHAGLWDVMSTTRAMRRLKPDPVPRELLEKLVQAAGWAPSGGNAQRQQWLILTDREKIERLAPIWAKSLRLYWATVGPQPSEWMSKSQVQALRRATEYQASHFAEIPALLVACYRPEPLTRRLWHNRREALATFAAIGVKDSIKVLAGSRRSSEMAQAASVYPAVQNCLLTARALGLGATLTTLHLTFEPVVKQILELPRGVKTFSVIPVGYPRGRFGPLRPKPLDELIRWMP